MIVSREQFTEAVAPHLDDRVLLNLSYTEAWCLLSALQLMLCQPELPALARTSTKHLTDILIEEIVPTSILAHLAKAGNIQTRDTTPE